MFTIETAQAETSPPPAERRRQDPAVAAPPSALTRLANPAWLMASLWQRKWLVLGAALLGLIVGGLASFLIPPKYVSTAQLFIDPRDLRVLQNEVSPNAASSDPTSTTAYLESQARVIASDSIKIRVIQSEGLDKDPEFGGEASKTGLMRLFSDLLPSSGAPPRDGVLYALAALDKNVTVRRGERTFVIDISVTAREAIKAAKIANALANAYLDDQASVRADAAQRATSALTGRLEELRNRLRIAEDKAEKYKEANNIVATGGKLISEEQLSLNNAQLVASRTRVTEAKSKYDQILATRSASIEAGAIPEAVASNTMTALRAQLGAALGKEADLVSSLGARHPALASSQSQVRDARRQITEELARISRAAKAEYDRAVESERQIARRVEELKRTQYVTSRASVELRELEREVESSRVVYDAFLRRARETGELSGIDTTNARVISQAVPPLEKSGITRRTVALLGGFVGGGAGVAAALALALFGARGPVPAPLSPPAPAPASVPAPAPEPRREGLRWPFRRPNEPAPMAAAAPPIAPRPAQPPAIVTRRPAPPPGRPSEPNRASWRRFIAIPGGQSARKPEILRAAAAPLLATLPAVRHRRWRNETGEARSVFQGKAHLVDVVEKPKGSFAKVIRQIRAMLAEHAAPDSHRRVLVLGLRRNAGASTLALNLALDAALAGQAAMLIDAGLGENGLTTVFAPDARLGLHEIATGSAGLMRAALQDEGTSLFFLPRVGRVDLVGAAEIERDVLGAARRFSPVVIDGGALDDDLLAARFVELVDDIVLVLREGEVKSGDLERMNAALGEHAGKLRGFVVNEA